MARVQKASKPREIGLPQNANIVKDFIDEQQENGSILKVRVGRRNSNPFEALHTAGTISSEERTAVYDLIKMYAKSKGLAGRPEDELGIVERTPTNPHLQNLHMANYGVAYRAVMGRLDQWPEMLLMALIKDFVEGDGAADTDDGTRWRAIVRERATKWNERLKSARQASNDPIGAYNVDIRVSEAGNVIARAIRTASTASVPRGVEHRALPQVITDLRKYAKDNDMKIKDYLY